jgi:hypothetical protein
VTKAEELNLHGLPPTVAGMIEDLPPGQVCGRCESFDAEEGLCTQRGFKVAPRDPGCMLWAKIEYSDE